MYLLLLENSTTNPDPPPSPHYSRVVYIVYTICICVLISSGSGFRKSFIFNSKNVSYLLKYEKIRHLFCVLNVFKASDLAALDPRENKYNFQLLSIGEKIKTFMKKNSMMLPEKLEKKIKHS